MLLIPQTLTRHAVRLGATGSGKTGLCTGILEDLALAGIPLLILDLKGDMSNMALVFRDLAAASFAPWTSPGQDPAKVEQAWVDGLAKAGMGTADRARTANDDHLTAKRDGAALRARGKLLVAAIQRWFVQLANALAIGEAMGDTEMKGVCDLR